MAEVKVTQGHRERALKHVRCGCEPTPRQQHWLSTGELPKTGSVLYTDLERAVELAQYDAEAEERGRAAERADVVAWHRSKEPSARLMGGAIGQCWADSHLDAAEAIERGEHVRKG